jgi:TOD1/MUCI70, glycosyltransferase-like domain
MYDNSSTVNSCTAAPATAAGLGSIVVYTAITARYDSLQELARAATTQAAFVVFLDEPSQSATWRVLPAHGGFADPNRNAKIHKILPHVHLPAAEYTLWIDGSVTFLEPDSIARLIDVHLADCDLAVFRHRTRTCVYQEASVCLQRRLDEPEVIWQQVCRYTQEGYPANAGLAECSVILRRHTPAVKAFNEAWWDEITRGSRRDQLSFGYVARKVGLRYGFLPGTISDNPWFRRGLHAVPTMPETGAVADAGKVAPGLDSISLDGSSPDSILAERPPRFYRSSSISSGRGRTIAFGRVRDKPSWSWVGFDVARELARHYDVILYDSMTRAPRCDVLFVVKKRPHDRFVEQALQNGTKLVYCPIDDYDGPEQIAADAAFLGACSMLVVHCERLIPALRPHCPNVHFVEHHTRYALHEMADYKESGYVLWIGSCQYVPFLLAWLEQHPIEHEIKILSDFEKDNARAKAYEHAAAMGLGLEISHDTTSVAGHRVYRWSEERQQQMMDECRAALDVKMTRFFAQRHKPPAKAQQYVASGIPFAVNPDSYSAEYFRSRGFDVASPLEPQRWFSREYWEATRAAAERLRAATSIEVVAARYRELIESL